MSNRYFYMSKSVCPVLLLKKINLVLLQSSLFSINSNSSFCCSGLISISPTLISPIQAHVIYSLLTGLLFLHYSLQSSQGDPFKTLSQMAFLPMASHFTQSKSQSHVVALSDRSYLLQTDWKATWSLLG